MVIRVRKVNRHRSLRCIVIVRSSIRATGSSSVSEPEALLEVISTAE